MRDALCSVIRPEDAWAWLLYLVITAPLLFWQAWKSAPRLVARIEAWLFWLDLRAARRAHQKCQACGRKLHGAPGPTSFNEAWKQYLNVDPAQPAKDFSHCFVKGEGDRPAGEELGRERRDG